MSPTGLPPRRAGTAPSPAAAEAWQVLRLAWPLALSNLCYLAISTTDVIMIGWLGAEALAAGTLAFNLYLLFAMLQVGLAAAVQPLASQARGARDARGLRRTVRQGLWAVIIVSVPSILALLCGERILLLLGQEPEAARAAGLYLGIACFALPFATGMRVLAVFLSVLERAHVMLWATAAGALLNAVANYALIFGHWGFPRLELQGAAWATLLVHVLGFSGLALYVRLSRRTRRYHVFTRFWRPDWQRLGRIFALAAPMSATQLAETGLFSATTFMVGWFGTIALSANAIAMQLTGLTFMIPLGVAQATAVRVGMAVGARDLDRVGRAGWSGMAIALAVMSLSALSFLAMPEVLISLFLDPGNPQSAEVARLAVGLLGVAALFQLFDATQVVGIGMLRGLSDARVPMLIATFGYWVCGFGLAYLLGLVAGLGPRGVWFGFVAGLGTVGLLTAARFALRERLGLVRPALA